MQDDGIGGGMARATTTGKRSRPTRAAPDAGGVRTRTEGDSPLQPDPILPDTSPEPVVAAAPDSGDQAPQTGPDAAAASVVPVPDAEAPPNSPPHSPLPEPLATAESEPAPASVPQASVEASVEAPPGSLRSAPPVAGRPAPAATPRRAGGAFAPVLGGVIAAALGAGVALWLFPQGWQPAPAPALATAPDLAPALAALEARLATLEARPLPDASRGPVPDTAPDTAATLAALESRLAVLEQAAPDAAQAPDLTPLSDRIAALEAQLPARIASEVSAAGAALEARLAAQSRAAEISAEDAAEARARADRRALIAGLILAADSGAPAADDLGRLATLADVPAALAPMADGLPTLAALQAAFPAAARAALAAAPPPPDAGATDRLIGFLRAQTGARSLAPREGQDTDAILSRAEAAVRGGDLTAALSEIGALPPGPAAALADWRLRAAARHAALVALSELQARSGEE
jgi:hypothetical protein